MTVPTVGDTVLLDSYLINTRVYGIVVPSGQPAQFTATYEIQGDQGTMTIAAVVGPTGEAGQDAFVLNFQNDAIDDPSSLPQTLQNSAADIGKFWIIDDVDANGDIIGSSSYIWYGTGWRRIMNGTPGPPGPVPIITPSVNPLSWPNNATVTPGGTLWEPTMQFNLPLPPGPEGPGAALALCPDVNETSNPPVPGDILAFSGSYTTQYVFPPTGFGLNGLGSGGTLASGTYYYVVTALSAAGQSTPSSEQSVTLSGSTSSVLLEWNQMEGATGYKIYRGTTAGGEGKLLATISSGATTTYTDTGSAGTSVTPPNTNTASVQYPLWAPAAISQFLPSPFSMPEAAFTSFSGISQRAGIGSFAIPPQPFPWTPIVWGHIGAFGIELSANPLLIGCEILLGDPTAGQLIGRGFGNSNGEVNIMPHYSNPNNPAVAITPTNDTAIVPANNSNPAESTIYVNLYNDGAIGLYQFSPTDAQVFIMLVPLAA